MLDYATVKNWSFNDVHQVCSSRDALLYALSIGLGDDPIDTAALRYTYEKSQQVFPTMATVLGYPGAWMRDPRSTVDALRVLHGEQTLRIHAPFSVGDSVYSTNRVESVTDKGAGKGAIVVISRATYAAKSNELLAESQMVIFARGDGGFSNSGPNNDPPPASLPAPPTRAPDLELRLPTRTDQALLFRLNGDYNPIHADPAIAKKAGLERPVLHGLCTYALAAVAILRADPRKGGDALRSLGARFTAPVIPGETVSFELWYSGLTEIQFRARAVERGVIVLNNGVCEVA